MTHLKASFAITTALTLSMGAAFAGDNNELFLEQAGDSNVANVVQSTSGLGNNQIGTAADPVTQQGDNNLFIYSDKGCCNGDYRGDNDILKAEQTGDGNEMHFKDWNIARHNTIEDAQQTGDGNYLTVGHNGGKDNTIQKIGQTGAVNDIRINQDGTGGMIQNVQITGDGNGNGGSHVNWQDNWGVLIQQRGSNSIIRNATIEGSDNIRFHPAAFATHGTAMRINQYGEANDANAVMRGSNGNAIVINQTGLGAGGNVADVQQGISSASTGNAAKVEQNGDSNSAAITQNGSYNTVVATQLGSGNTLTASFTGDSNGTGSLTGVAGDLADADSGDELFEGNMFQDNGGVGAGNSISYTVNGNNNLFAFAQLGAGNAITGSVGATGGGSNGNQVAVLQNGSGNGTTFAQTGAGSNNLAVSQ